MRVALETEHPPCDEIKKGMISVAHRVTRRT